MTAEQGPKQGMYEIDFPTEVTASDVANLEVYLQRRYSPDEAAALLIIQQAEYLKEVHLKETEERLSANPKRLGQVVNNQELIFDMYILPATILLEAKKIQAEGVDMPILLKESSTQEYLKEHFAPGSGTSIEAFNAIMEEVERASVMNTLTKWQERIRLLQLLKDRGPAGVVNDAADRRLMSLDPIYQKRRDAVELGRQRFHQFHETAKDFLVKSP